MRGIAQNLSVSWTSRLDYAARWIDQNKDIAALLVDTQVDRTGWSQVLDVLRGLTSRPRVVVITPENAGPQREFMEADEFLTRNESLSRDLSVIVRRALDRTQKAPVAPTPDNRGEDQHPEVPAASAERQAHLEAMIELERAARSDVERQLAEAQAALHEAEKRHRSAMAAAAEQAAQQQAQYEIGLARAAASWEMVDEQLREAALNVARSRRDHEAAAANVDRLLRREAELSALLGEATANGAALEQRLVDAEAAVEAANRRAADELRTVTEQFAERQRGLEGLIAGEIEKRTGVEQNLARVVCERDAAQEQHAGTMATATARLRELELALQLARQDCETKAADVERLATREAELTSMLGAAGASNTDHERPLAATEAAFQDVSERATRDHLASAKRAAEREAELDAQIQHERAANDGLEHANADLTAQLADTRTVCDRLTLELSTAALRIADLDARHREMTESRDTLERTLRDTRSAAVEAQRSSNEEINAARAHSLEQASQFESRLSEAQRKHETDVAALQRTLEDARAEFEATLHRLSAEHGAALAARDREIEQRERQNVAANQAIQDWQQRNEALQREADRVPQLLRQLDDNRAESERLFQQAPVAMFRCGREGALRQANRAWWSLVRRKNDELRGEDFAAAVFESPKDLSWLVERSLGTRTKESIETTLRRQDNARLFVRLSACASPADDVIEIVVEDLTRPRILQDRLAQSGRMEAVGRVASEVALACGKLVGDARQRAEQWLSDGGTTRQYGERLLDDLARAAAYLDQLVAYGGEQPRRPAPVDLHTVVRDLAPVLKHVAGDNVEVRLPEPASSVEVDVEAERVERLLVNLAAYGRERMPFGCELSIEIGTSVVGQHFAAKYPNVRPGPHALITVTEVRRAAAGDALLQSRDGANVGDDSRRTATRKPAVDLGTLQTLVGECGGHLWMKVQPLGDIVAKIRLPLLTSYGHTHAPSTTARPERTRSITRLFQL